MAPRKEETPRIIDKRNTDAGSEYLLSITGDWISSSTCRFVNPELVELYEWLLNSEWHKSKTRRNATNAKNISVKGVRKRLLPAAEEETNAKALDTTGTTQNPDGSVEKHESQSSQQQISTEDESQSIPHNVEVKQNKPLETSDTIPERKQGLATPDQVSNQDQVSDAAQDPAKSNSETLPSVFKKPRLEKALSCSDELDLLSIDVQDESHSAEQPVSTAAASSPLAASTTSNTVDTDRIPAPKPDPPLKPTITESESEASTTSKTLLTQEHPQPSTNNTEDSSTNVDSLATVSQQVLDFNRNSEQMIEIFFNEGMDASGVEMFNTLLGPNRRPTPAFVAALFFAVVLSPLTEPATIEAAIHAFDRLLSMHGPEPFSQLWDVQKRRRELSDGKSPFSKLATFAIPSATRAGGGGSSGFDSRDFPDTDSPSSRSRTRFGGYFSSTRNDGLSGSSTVDDEAEFQTTWRLPSWNNVWDLIRTELGLDTKQESIQHIALQELAIKSRLQEDDPSPATTPRLDSAPQQTNVVREEKEIRDEVGRMIVGFLLRVLECDSILSNVSPKSYFCQKVLQLDFLSENMAVKQALDVIFQAMTIATSNQHFGPPSSAFSKLTPALSSSSGTPTQTVSAPWPVDVRCQLSPIGMDILQMSVQFLLLLVRYIEAGVLSMNGRGLEDLALEVMSRLSKVNRDRFPTQQRFQSQQQLSLSQWSQIPFILEKSLLDQTEIFLKMIIQGSGMLDSGTGVRTEFGALDLRTSMTENELQEGSANGKSTVEGFGLVSPRTTTTTTVNTGSTNGSSLFVLILIDTWFRNKTTSKKLSGFAKHFSFRQVIENYAMPCPVRRNTDPATFGTEKTKKVGNDSNGSGGAGTTKPRRIRPTRKGTRRQEQRSSSPAGVEDMSFEMENPEYLLRDIISAPHTSSEDVNKNANSDKGLDKDLEDDHYDMTLWNAQHVEQVEWTVMMVETLVWAWIGTRGVRLEDVQGTSLEHVCFPDDSSAQGESGTKAQELESSGWQKMKELLQIIGGPLKTRWELLEMIIQTAVVDEEISHW